MSTDAFTRLEVSQPSSLVAADLYAALRAMAHYGSSSDQMGRVAALLVEAEKVAAQDFMYAEAERSQAAS